MHCFNKLTGAPSGEVLPELVNLYKPPFYLATWKDGAALLTNKLHSKDMLPKDVIFFAPCHVGGIKGRETALASLKAEGFTREEPSSEFGHRSREATLAPLEAEGFTREESSLEFDRQGREGAVNNLINEGVDPKKASSELMIPVAANRRKSGTCKFLGGCNKAIRYSNFCKNHRPNKAKKSDRCGSCGVVLGVVVKVIGGHCYPCYRKPELTAARKKTIAEKKAGRGECSTPGCTGVNHHGCGKCICTTKVVFYDY